MGTVDRDELMGSWGEGCDLSYIIAVAAPNLIYKWEK